MLHSDQTLFQCQHSRLVVRLIRVNKRAGNAFFELAEFIFGVDKEVSGTAGQLGVRGEIMGGAVG